MRLINDVRHYSVKAGARDARATVRVRGIDARVGGRGLVIQQHEPLAFALDGATYRLPTPVGTGIAFALVPVAAMILRRMLIRKEHDA